MRTKNPHIGGLFDDWLKAEGFHEEVTTAAVKRVIASTGTRVITSHVPVPLADQVDALAARLDRSRCRAKDACRGTSG
jgi:uncharacterized protein (DUF1684 family)